VNPYRENTEPKCVGCDGKGKTFEWTGMGSEWETCPRCNGSGKADPIQKGIQAPRRERAIQLEGDVNAGAAFDEGDGR